MNRMKSAQRRGRDSKWQTRVRGKNDLEAIDFSDKSWATWRYSHPTGDDSALYWPDTCYVFLQLPFVPSIVLDCAIEKRSAGAVVVSVLRLSWQEETDFYLFLCHRHRTMPKVSEYLPHKKNIAAHYATRLSRSESATNNLAGQDKTDCSVWCSSPLTDFTHFCLGFLLFLQNKGKGGKNRRRGKNENESEKRELVFKEEGQGQ